MSVDLRHDVIVVGGGLSGGLLAWRLKQRRPELDVLLLEGAATLGGNHTWSFFESDLTAAQNAWIEPLVCHRWPGYEVRFPKRARTLGSGYRSIFSQKFADVLTFDLGAGVVTGVKAIAVGATQVQLEDQRTFSATCVIDARGEKSNPHLLLGYQKFLGLEVRLDRPHRQAVPIIMDATVAQNDGYRFVYTLPFTADTVLIEDTYYSDGEAIAPDQLRGQSLIGNTRVQQPQ